MAVYNTSFMNNATNPVDLIVGIGSSMGDQYLIGNLILFSFFLVYLAFSYSGKTELLDVLVYDSLLTTILCIFLFFAELISYHTIIFPFVIFIFSMVYYFFS